MVAEEAPNTPPSAATSNGAVFSPQGRQNLPSPWASVVRGDTEHNSSSPPPEQGSAVETPAMGSSSPEVQPESSDVNDYSNAGRQTRPAWNRPSNGVVVEAGPVMGGAVSWPALSESTRPVPRSSWSDSSRTVADGSDSPSQAPVITQSPQRTTANTHTHSASNNTVPARPRSRNRGGGGGGGSSGSGPSQNNFNRPTAPMPPPPPIPVFEVAYGMASPMQDPRVRGARPLGGIGGSQPQTDNDHSSQRNTSRRGGNYGPRPRGDGQYQNNYRGRRDQDRRDVHLPPQYLPPPMGYMPSPMPPGAGPFMPPSPVRVFPGQMGFDVASPLFYVPSMPPESFMAMPLPPPLPSMLFPPVNENLMNSIVKQIDYWFSDENLVKDNFLRSNMDDQGWVPVSLLASFPRVQQLTKDINEILEALRYSTIVEIQGDKVRRRNDWNRWIISSGSHNDDSGSRTPGAATENVLAASMQHVMLDDAMTNANGVMEESKGHTDMAAGKISPEETTSQSRLANGEDTSEEAH